MTSLLSNGGFEDAADGVPAGWTYSGPVARRDETWPEGGAHGGVRCVRFAARTDRQAWKSERVPVQGSVPYRLEWWTSLAGSTPWHWTTHTGFIGVRVTFFDAAGDRCGITERRIRSIGTDGWVRCWLDVNPAPEASSCTVSLVCEAEIETDGTVAFDDVALVPAGMTRTPAGRGHLRGVVWTAEDPAPGFARVLITAADGRHYAPENSYQFLDGSFHATGEPFELALPAGRAAVLVTRGFEYSIWRDTVDIRAGQRTEVAPRLAHRWPLSAEGWYSGDAHIHLFFHRHSLHPQMVPADVFAVARAEGLGWLSFKGEEKEVREFIARSAPLCVPGFTGEIGIEAVSDFHGHVYTLNARTIPADGFPMKLVPWPMNLDLGAALDSTGGALVYAHPSGDLAAGGLLEGIGDPSRLLLAREWPVDLALGQNPAFDILAPDGPNATAVKLPVYYRMLNAGFRSAVTASTDAYVDQGRMHPGAARTYAYTPFLAWSEIADAHRKGATFATNGPLVWLSVNGKRPGEEARVARNGSAEVQYRAASNRGLTRAEIIVNGRVAYTALPGADGEIRGSFVLPVSESCWVALRAFGPRGEGLADELIPDEWKAEGIGQFAHTSPVYVMVDGRAMRPDPEAARFFAQWIGAYRNAVLNRADLFENENGTWGEDVKARILERLDRAEAVYLERAREGRSGAPARRRANGAR